MGAKTLCLSRLSKGFMLKLPSIKESKDRAMVSTSPRDSACASLERSLSFKNWGVESTTPKSSSFKFQSLNMDHKSPVGSFPSPKSPSRLLQSISPRSPVEQDAAAVKLQSVYKSYRTRRNLADCAVVAEELWWKTFDRMVLSRSSITFFDGKKEETVAGRWMRARNRAAKVGKGLSKDEKAQKLALQHWLEAIDPRHRYGHNLHIYYNVWFETESTQPFFYWLDLGHGKELSLDKCPRSKLQHQCIKYLEPKEREAYEVIVADGLLVYKQSRSLVDTVEGSKWIFVLSTSRNLYVGQKKKGEFQHSSFLSGAATTAAGRLVAKDGVLEAIWPYSGHYLPTEENFKEFISFLVDNNVDLTNVKRCSVDDDDYSSIDNQSNDKDGNKLAASSSISKADGTTKSSSTLDDNKRNITDQIEVPIYEHSKRLPCNWTSGVGPRIMCVRDYPVDLQSKALEQVNLSPRVDMSPIANRVPIPSPRPSPRVRLSPRLAYMGIPSPRVSLTLPPPMKH